MTRKHNTWHVRNKTKSIIKKVVLSWTGFKMNYYLACLAGEALTILGAEAVPPRFLDDGKAVAITDLREDHSKIFKSETKERTRRSTLWTWHWRQNTRLTSEETRSEKDKAERRRTLGLGRLSKADFKEEAEDNLPRFKANHKTDLVWRSRRLRETFR